MLADVDIRVSGHALTILGGFHPRTQDGTPEGTKTLLLLGPKEPAFWPHFTVQPEWHDGAPDPVDRWSRRVIGHLACDLGAKALFPFTGPPHLPFYKWALATGRFWPSPVSLLVHDQAGLMVSIRGALALRHHLDLPEQAPNPCATCTTKPCLAACPPRALTGAGYDVPGCHRYLDTDAGQSCMTAGCAVRRACPLSIRHARMHEQSAYHMGQFHR
jgi:epoxyqueuosine reductase